jgi:hypothetical protein
MAVEYATSDGKPGGTFAGLALQSGFSEAECAMAARNDMLIGIVRVAELRARRERHPGQRWPERGGRAGQAAGDEGPDSGRADAGCRADLGPRAAGPGVTCHR